MSEFPQVEETLYAWFKQQRITYHAPISGDLLKQKAQFCYREITKKDNFRAYDARHGIRFLLMSGEKLSTDESEASQFIQDLNVKITELGLTPEQLYDDDETGLNRRQLPTKTFLTEGKVSGKKPLKSLSR